ncbi:MAG: hypothetical protein ACXW11_03420 [Methylotenera sp.]
MFLRTRCDKELYLSLHDRGALAGAGMPEPVKRPGIGLLSVDGKEFEVERNDQLARIFAGEIVFNKGSKSYNDIDLEKSLIAVTSTPKILLQGKFSIAALKDQTLKNIGLSPNDIAVMPTIADFIPDILIVREP